MYVHTHACIILFAHLKRGTKNQASLLMRTYGHTRNTWWLIGKVPVLLAYAIEAYNYVLFFTTAGDLRRGFTFHCHHLRYVCHLMFL